MAKNAKNKIKTLQDQPNDTQYNVDLDRMRSGTINGAQSQLVGTDGIASEFSIKQKKQAELEQNDLFKIPERKEKKEKTVVQDNYLGMAPLLNKKLNTVNLT